MVMGELSQETDCWSSAGDRAGMPLLFGPPILEWTSHWWRFRKNPVGYAFLEAAFPRKHTCILRN